MGVGDKAKVLNALDREQADASSLISLYCIEVTVMKSPKHGVKCGAIVVFRLNEMKSVVDFEAGINPAKMSPKMYEDAQRRANEQKNELAAQTENMHIDPILFKETDGRWLPWAMDKALALYDQYGGSAKIVLKCPSLKVRCERSARQIAALRNRPAKLFPIMKDIDKLLDGNFQYDPWSDSIRRGAIDANMSKR